MSSKLIRTLLSVQVLNVRSDVINDAKVMIHIKSGTIPFAFDADRLIYSVEVPVGTWQLEVKHDLLQGQVRAVTVGPAPSQELFILGKPGVKTYFREKVRVPVDADPNLFAITIDRKLRGDSKFIQILIEGLDLEPQKVPNLAEESGVRLFRTRSVNIEKVLKMFSEHPSIEHAGALVSMREGGFSYLTEEIVVRFRGASIDTVRKIAKENGYKLVRELIYSPSTYVLRWQHPATLDILESIEKMASRNDVEWAEPSLAVTPEIDTIIPSDFLWPGLWDRRLIGLQNAWQHLQDAGYPTFGDPNILFTVWDSGVQSDPATGQPTCQDFSGTLSNGFPKVLKRFDFDNMVENNDYPWSNHGSGVAGVSVAIANDGFGLAGSAPNVQIMTIIGRRPYIDIEVADQYIWMAGFDPHSPLAGFPTAPPSRGADVITCSLTPGAGAPLSGTARATLDFVTTFGRGGKGTMCFFSTGNVNANNVTTRPYSAYEKCFGIAATSLANDGVTEIRAAYSGWGQIALCSPSQDQDLTVHNPPTGFMPWGADHRGMGNLISLAQAQTTLTAATAAGATVLSVVSVTGFSVGSVIHVGAIGGPGSEPAHVSTVNVGSNQLTIQGHDGDSFTGGLLNGHPVNTVVLTGPANHMNNFGGTSSATPLCAGVAALVLSANPELTYIEAREILRTTAVKFDLTNTNPNGQWLDANGNPSVTSGLPAIKSQWYGYGRVDAAASVQTAVSFASGNDLVIRDNLADTGAVASSGAFWNSPDIWCRQTAPTTDSGALPANYATPGPHSDPIRGKSNWIYARVRNNGTVISLDAWIRISVAHWPGLEFTYATSFEPANGPGDPLAIPMTAGTYFIGEAKVTGIPPSSEQIVNVEWPAGLIPPANVTTSSGTVQWHPCLLVEITPHDGPTAAGIHVWDDNNLAQKNISIVETDSGKDFAVAEVIGHPENPAKYLVLEIIRGKLPKEVQLYIDLMDPLLRHHLRKSKQNLGAEPLTTTRNNIELQSWSLGWYDGREVIFLRPQPRVQVPIMIGNGRTSPLIIGGVIGNGVKRGTYEVVLIQRQPKNEISGSSCLIVKIGR